MDLPDLARNIHSKCVRCRTCQKECLFLQKYGLPGDIAKSILDHNDKANPFECSLCQLCAGVCPEGINPSRMILAMRTQAVSTSPVILKKYRRILVYQALGRSRLLSLYKIPEGCRSVFFPGCSISGTRPESTWKLFQGLRISEPGLGVVLDCCCKPSHDLGNMDMFKNGFQRIVNRLHARGVEEIITACPSCFWIFKSYARHLSVRMIWEYLNPGKDCLVGAERRPRVRLHDPCTTRFFPDVQEKVRALIRGLGLDFQELPLNSRHTLCCGEGGSVGFVNKDIAMKWGTMRKEQAGNDAVITYCAGCAGFLDLSGITTIHLADLLLDLKKALSGEIIQDKPPKTYWNRLRLKRRFVRTILK